MVEDENTRINKLEVELASLREKVAFFTVIYGKFDAAIGKVEEMIENRRYENNEEIKDIYEKLAESEQNILEEMKALKQDMKNLHEENSQKIDNIDRWRWFVIGAAAAVGWFLNKIFFTS